MKFRIASENAFCAAFFFLPVSKPLMFLSLGTAFLLFMASGGLANIRQSWQTFPWVMPALILSALPWVALLVHSDPHQQSESHLHLGYYWLMAFMVFLVSSQMSIVPWMRAFLWGTFAVFCYSQLNQNGLLQFNSVPSALNNTIMFSQFLALGIALLSILYKHENKWRVKTFYLTGMAVFFWGVAAGSGRTGMLTVLILLPWIFSNIFGREYRRKVLIGCLIAGALLAMSPMVQHRIGQAVNDLQSLEKNVTETSIGYRFEMWGTAWDIFRAHPILGEGPSAFKNEWNKQPQSDNAKAFVEPHNAFFFYASSYGFIGLAALIWLYAALLWTGWTHRYSLEGGICFAFAVVCIAGSFTNTMFAGTVSRSLVMLFIGLQGSLLYAASKPILRQQKAATP
jgi:O-antigen ligase